MQKNANKKKKRKGQDIIKKVCNRCGRIVDFNLGCLNCKKTYKKRKAPQDLFRNSSKWQKKRKEIFTKAFYLCEYCKSKGILTYNNLSVHHITPLEENIDLGLENNNLIVLCGLCHKEAEDGHIDKQLLYELAEKRENED